jgi:hypothetical protein
MRRDRFCIAIGMAVLLCCMTLVGCGGGGEGEPESSAQPAPPPGPSSSSLAWDPPTTFEDNSPLDPYRDLDYYEIYLREDTNFTDDDAPVAQVAAVTNVLSVDGTSNRLELAADFALGNLLPFTQPGAAYYLSVKSVGADGLKSGFSAPIVWNLS